MNGPLHNRTGADAYNAVQELDGGLIERRRHVDADAIARPAQIQSTIVLMMVLGELAVLAFALSIVIQWLIKP